MMGWKIGSGGREEWENAARKGQGMHRLRMIADFILVGAFGFAAPAMLAPIGRNWGVMLVSVATFAIGIAFLWDGLRMAQRPHR
ncbi:MAG TPA: hypothetical protein VMD92_12200 [Acidobacteriaceae bacterium]|nr:hypothetical protein [Acidobacteriaceae bacterium]